jgi:hypothetical protein
MADLYPRDLAISNSQRLYIGTATVGNIDLRAELHKILFGDRNHPGEGHKVLIRRMDSTCPCMLEEKGQKHREPDPKCSVCHGEGYAYSEFLCTAWRSLVGSKSGALPASYMATPPGITDIIAHNFFFEYNTELKDIDKIIELNLGVNGALPSSLGELQQREKFKILQLITYRADNGRIEFIRAICQSEEW